MGLYYNHSTYCGTKMCGLYWYKMMIMEVRGYKNGLCDDL